MTEADVRKKMMEGFDKVTPKVASMTTILMEVYQDILWVFPYWLSLFTCPIHFLECLDFIKAWCCERNIGTAIIYDPQGANPLMIIKYRQYKSEVLNELKQ